MQPRNPQVLKKTRGGKVQLTSDIYQGFYEGLEQEDEARSLQLKTALYA